MGKLLHNTTHLGWGQLSKLFLERCKGVSRTNNHDLFVFKFYSFRTGEVDLEVKKIHHSLTQKPNHQSVLTEVVKESRNEC